MRLRSAIIGLISLTTGVFVWSAPAAADAPTPGATAKGTTNVEHCNVVLRKLQPGQTASTVVSRDCGTDPVALAERGALAGTLLSIVFEHAVWKGRSVNIIGSDGPCDSEGYRFNTTAWNDEVGGISSYFVTNSCWLSGIWGPQAGRKTFCWDVSYVGDAHNDRVHELTLARPVSSC